MSYLNEIEVELSVVAGNGIIPLQKFLKMGRGAIVELDTREHDPAILLANNTPIAEGEIDFENDKVLFRVQNMLSRDYNMPTAQNALFSLN